MNPAHEAIEILHRQIPNLPETTDEAEVANYVASAQVWATLALVNAIEGIGHDIQDALRTTNAELGSIAISIANLPIGEGR